ncbi:hypothetical protein Z951_33965 [Streptomyces sp. PRh5]|nr:hypothetical protein Z951_33965 [Streptomyces sp. PRh5]
MSATAFSASFLCFLSSAAVGAGIAALTSVRPWPAAVMCTPTSRVYSAILWVCLATSRPHSRKASAPSPSQCTRSVCALSSSAMALMSSKAAVKAAPTSVSASGFAVATML